MRVRRTLGILLIGMLALSALAACKGNEGDIKIALCAPMTGSSAQWGEALKDGVQMAVDEINASGGLLGKKVTVVYEDDKGDPKEAVNVAQKLATDDSVVAVIGHYFTSCTMAASPIYQKAGIPEIAIASTHPDATKAGDYIFRINVTNTHQGAGIAKYLAEQGKKKIAILYVNDDYGKGISQITSDTVKELGGEVVYIGTVAPSGEQDFTVLLTNVKNSGADALVLLVFYAAGAQICVQAKELSLDIPIVCSDAVYSPDFITLGGDAVEGVNVATWFHPDSPDPGTRKYIEDFKAKYNRDADTWSPYAYDAVKLLAEAITRAGKVDRSAIRDEIAATKGFQGAVGVTTFNDERVPDVADKKLLMTVVRDGEFVLLP